MPGSHENVVFEMGRHAVQTMLHDALVRGSRAHGLLYGDARVIERAVPLCDETADEDADRRPPMAVYAASDETLEQLRARMGGGLPGVIVRLDTKGRLEAVMRDARGRERSLDLREDGAAPVRAAGLYPMRHKE
jgi:hypothetical protein